MRVMMIVKANPKSEAGVLPTEAQLAAMGKYNEELQKRGCCSTSRGSSRAGRGAGQVLGRQADGGRRAVHRGEGDHRRLLGHPGQVARGGDRMGQANPGRADRDGRGRAAPVLRAGRLRPWRRQWTRPRSSARSSPPTAGPSGSGRRSAVTATADETRRRIEAIWRIESPKLHRGAGAHGARHRPRGGARPGRAGRGARAVAGVGRSGQSGRLADGDRQAPRHRRAAARQAARRASTRSWDAISTRAEASAPELRDSIGRARRGHRRRSAAADVHRLPPGAVDRGARGADAAAARRPDDRRDRAGVSGARADHRAADRARQADAQPRRTCRSRCRAAPSAPRGWPRCWR